MHILITNDDGVSAPGLLALVRALSVLGQVSVLAPHRNWSASGHVKTLHRPLRVYEATLADGSPALACDSAPSDCVALALLGMIKPAIDLVVSGINPNANVGHDITYSGTVTAAMEAVIFGVPGIAVSLDAPERQRENLDFSTAAVLSRQIIQQVIDFGLPAGILLNINIPYVPLEEINGISFTRQGQRIYRDAIVARQDPQGKPYYWIGGEAPTGIVEEGTDIGALAAKQVSVTPLQLDLTAYSFLDKMHQLHWQLKPEDSPTYR